MLRKRFQVRPSFAVILIGKDGGEKMRSHKPIPWEKLEATIDSHAHAADGNAHQGPMTELAVQCVRITVQPVILPNGSSGGCCNAGHPLPLR